MNEAFIVHLLREAFYTMLLISAPTLIVSMVVGLVVSIFQAATSIQEFTLSFVPKLVLIAIVLVLTMPWILETMITFTVSLFHQIPVVVH
ncbi:MAG: flagellar biosynthesis protein FliQ [Bacteroidetes bacterium]|nr:flagellar biosynthesis protein FliQ [Bacteroidota bacterium]